MNHLRPISDEQRTASPGKHSTLPALRTCPN